ncbi:type II toxin-antitoxin system HicA family toxin [Candidatus Gribaldobacteria bacterium]|nr:type II toxin-antitoxin system HicA family toxin [Candidatus Gribaldobacteria bacterium]
MAKIPITSGKVAIKALEKIGYNVVRTRGSHFRLSHKTKKPITIPGHSVLGKGLLRKILRDCDLSVEDFIVLLKK